MPPAAEQSQVGQRSGDCVFSSSLGWGCQSQLGVTKCMLGPPTDSADKLHAMQSSQGTAAHSPGWVWPPSQPLHASKASPGAGTRPQALGKHERSGASQTWLSLQSGFISRSGEGLLTPGTAPPELAGRGPRTPTGLGHGLPGGGRGVSTCLDYVFIGRPALH